MPAKKLWTEADLLALREMASAGLSDHQILESGRIDGIRSTAQVSNARQRYRIIGGLYHRPGAPPLAATMTRVVSETPDRTIYAPEEADDEPFDELLGRAIRQTRRDREKAQARRFALANIVTDRPIAIAFLSDQHLTMGGPCDVERAFGDAHIVQQTPGLYAMLGGDGVDNHIKHRAAMVGKGSRPTDEYRLYDGYLRTLGHKTLSVISGNHDDWTKDAAGIDMVGILAARHRLHYAPDMVVLTVRLVSGPHDTEGQQYVIKLRHQYRFGSSLNLSHTVKRMYDMDGETFDVGVVCHNHEAEVSTFNRHGMPRYAVRPGSYQVESSFSRRVGFAQSYPTCPGVVLWPGGRRIELFEDLRGLVEKLADARRQAA
jgi:hypothetical protein